MKNALINHVALVVDGSGSMATLQSAVVQIGDQLVAQLVEKSRETDQETRISLYVFEDTNAIHCHVYDKDVLRMPSLRGLYRTVGQTPLIDATMKAIDDLSKTATLYGDHAFLVYVLTDGQENASRHRSHELATQIAKLADNWTLVCFVPNHSSVPLAAGYGFPRENVQVWETTREGIKDVGRAIEQTVSGYYQMRSIGVRGTKNLFNVKPVTKAAITKAGLTPLNRGQYRLFKIDAETQIATFVESKLNRPYKLGEAYYQLIKREKVQPQKQLAIFDRKKSELFVGAAARQLLGLPDYEVTVGPEQDNFDVFIQSTSTNRKLLPNQKLVVLS